MKRKIYRENVKKILSAHDGHAAIKKVDYVTIVKQIGTEISSISN